MKRRWHNIFKSDNRALVLAMDHGMFMNVAQQGLKDPRKVVNKAVSGGIDAILTTFGTAQHCQKEIGNTGLILRVDGGTSQIHPSGNGMDEVVKTFNVEDAIRVGADGVMCMGFVGTEYEKTEHLAYFASECNKWGLVFAAEMIPGGFKYPDKTTLENIALANRIGAEYGADFVKSPFVGDATTFKEVIESCYKPILVLGGGKVRDDRGLLSMVKKAMQAGAKGAIIGRSIWRHEKVDKICAALAKIIHEDADIETALKELE